MKLNRCCRSSKTGLRRCSRPQNTVLGGVHLYPEVSAHLLRATESADWLEWRDWGNPIIAEPFEVKGGFVDVPSKPGNGIEWNEDAIRKFAY